MDIWEDFPLLKRLIGVVLLSLALILVVVVAWQFALDASLWFLGRQVEAVVVDSDAEVIRSDVVAGEEDEVELSFRYLITYEFVTPAGQTIRRTSTVAPAEWVGKGARVSAVYFPLAPQHNRLDQSRYVPLLACGYLPLVILAGTAVLAGWRMVRSRPVVALVELQHDAQQAGQGGSERHSDAQHRVQKG